MFTLVRGSRVCFHEKQHTPHSLSFYTLVRRDPSQMARNPYASMFIVLFFAILSEMPEGVQTKYSLNKQGVTEFYQKSKVFPHFLAKMSHLVKKCGNLFFVANL